MREYTQQLKRQIRNLSLQVVVIVGVLAAFSFGLARVAVVQYGQRVFESYSSPQQIFLIPGALSAAEVAALRSRIKRFMNGARGEKLRLTVSDINYLLGYLAPLGGNFRITHVSRESVRGHLSMPALSNGSLRYLNGSSEFKLNYRGRKPGLYVTRLAIEGNEAPRGLVSPMRHRNLLWQLMSPRLVPREVRKLLGSLQGIKLGDGWIEAVKA